MNEPTNTSINLTNSLTVVPALAEYLCSYQEQALRTAVPIEGSILNAEHFVVGLAEEAGEVMGLYKKARFFGHPLDEAKLTGELGDVLWYAVGLADAMNVDLLDLLTSDLYQSFVESVSPGYLAVRDGMLSRHGADSQDFKLAVLAPASAALYTMASSALNGFFDLRAAYARGTEPGEEDGEALQVIVEAIIFAIASVAALSSDLLGSSLTDVAEANLRKLRARFPEKFDREASINRDEAAEQAAIAG